MKQFTRIKHPFQDQEHWLLALDPAYNKSGYAVFKDGKLEGYGIIDVSKEKDHEHKIMEFGLALRNLIIACNPSQIASEAFLWVSRGGNAKGMQHLLKMRGIMEFIIGLRPHKVYHNSTWKKGLNGNFRASKEEILEFINKKYKLSLTKKEQDIADAIGIGVVANAEYQKRRSE